MADCDKARRESRKRLLEPATLLSMGHTLCIDSENLVCPGCHHGLAYAVPIPQKGSHLHSPARKPAGCKMSADDLHIMEGLVEGEDAACLVCLHMAHEDIVERFRKSGSRDMDEYLLFMFETSAPTGRNFSASIVQEQPIFCSASSRRPSAWSVPPRRRPASPIRACLPCGRHLCRPLNMVWQRYGRNTRADARCRPCGEATWRLHASQLLSALSSSGPHLPALPAMLLHRHRSAPSCARNARRREGRRPRYREAPLPRAPHRTLS